LRAIEAFGDEHPRLNATQCTARLGMTLPVSVWNRASIEAKLCPVLIATASNVRAVI
jgi:hypothetical protein